MTTTLQGYNPNRDSGIAEARSYIEISKPELQNALSEYDFVPKPTQRYFAQLVYNVGGNSGGSSLSNDQLSALFWLTSNITALQQLLNGMLYTYQVMLNQVTGDLTKENIIIPVTYSTNGKIQCIWDDVNGSGNIDDADNYLINVPGFVCSVACYNWVAEEGGQLTQQMERFLPKLTYTPANEEHEYGLTTIYLSWHEYHQILALGSTGTLQNGLKVDPRKIRIEFLQVPTKKYSNTD